MQKIKINAPVQIALDTLIFTIEEVKMKDLGITVYSSKALTVQGIKTNSKDQSMMDITMFDSDNREVTESFPKQRYIPSPRAGELFLNEQTCLDTIRKLTDTEHERVKKAYETISQFKEKYDNTESIAPDPEASDLHLKIKKSGKVIEVKEEKPLESKKYDDPELVSIEKD